MKYPATAKRRPILHKCLICVALVVCILGILSAIGLIRPRTFFVGSTPPEHAKPDRDTSEFSKLLSEQSYQRYKVSIYGLDRNDFPVILLQITRDGKVLHSQEGYKFYIGHNESAEEYNRFVPIGKDITGKGIPNLVVSEWTGGAHCCSNTIVFELGQNFQKLAIIDSGHSDTSHFEKNSGTAGLVFKTYDFIFANWNTCFADSPAPKLTLRYCDGEYRIADDLMRKPAPSKDMLQRLATHMRKKSTWIEEGPSPPLWSAMLDLIYSGNAKSAWLLFDMAWPKKAEGKDVFLKEFREQLALSAYADQITMLNDGIPVCGDSGHK